MIKDLYAQAIINNLSSLVLIIDFLVNEKKVLTLEDGVSKLDHYLQEKFKVKMNEYLNEYNQVKKIVQPKREIEVYQIRLYDNFYYVAAYTEQQAEAFFKSEFGEVHDIRIEIPELEVFNDDRRYTIQHFIMRHRTFPAILGHWNLFEGEANGNHTSLTSSQRRVYKLS